jgi:hypothetical protein
VLFTMLSDVRLASSKHLLQSSLEILSQYAYYFVFCVYKPFVYLLLQNMDHSLQWRSLFAKNVRFHKVVCLNFALSMA